MVPLKWNNETNSTVNHSAVATQQYSRLGVCATELGHTHKHTHTHTTHTHPHTPHTHTERLVIRLLPSDSARFGYIIKIKAVLYASKKKTAPSLLMEIFLDPSFSSTLTSIHYSLPEFCVQRFKFFAN